MADRLERLINLVIALRETRRPLTAGEIRGRVAGYGQDDPQAFRRMFERDKADLRNLGVPLETAALDAFDDQHGYRIRASAYDLPDIQLEPEELAALALAVQATGLAEEAGAGLLKLEVDAGEPGLGRRPAQAGVEVSLEAPHRASLMRAQITRTPVRFRYRPAGREESERTVEPHALVHRRGRWYLVGHDRDRDDRRAFRLDRIAGAVHEAGPAASFAAPPPANADDVVPVAPASAPAQAEVAAHPDVAWQVARRAGGGGQPAPDGWIRYSVPVGDPERFIAWALEFGADIEVQAPAELRQQMVEWLEHVAAAAGGES
ncbi:MAG TPA: WYL domain-containing protein [Egibacteraceae bacterium]|nr:WYL domain-containing protein [Egibacteraceae bacterium]